MNNGPLAGIRVLELGAAVALPLCTRLLAELGAEVIKAESERRPDNFRRGEGSFSDIGAGPNVSRSFNEFNRNKLGITVNLATPQGRDLLRRLVALCDVVANNYSAGILPRWGLDYQGLRRVKPDIICLDTQGLGKTGPRRDHVTLGLSIMPLMGMTHLWSPYESPRPVGAQAAHPDYVSATLSALAILAALRHRDATGEGQHIDVAQAEAAGLLLSIPYLECTVNGREPRPLGNVNPYAAPHGVYPCARDPRGGERGERWCAIAVTTPAQWRGLGRAMGDPEWCREPRFADLLGRRRHRAEVDALVSAWTRQHTPHEVMSLLQAEGVPAGAVQNGADLYHDPHLHERGFILEAQHPGMPAIAYAGVTMRLSATPAEVRQRAPTLGEHNDCVYGELLGMDIDERRALAAQGVLA